MKLSNSVIVTTIIAAVLTYGSITSAATAHPANQSTAESAASDNRSLNKLGAYVGILGDPHPTLLGFNVAYNALDYMRVSAGFGQVSVSTLSLSNAGLTTESTSLTTLGLGTKFMMPGWNFTPTVGFGYSHISITSTAVMPIDYKANNYYTNFGFDWQASTGFNLGGGLNVSLNSGAPTAPYINVGYFFM